MMKVRAPGKLILSGEHAIVYGQPALAVAMDRYVTTNITAGTLPRVLLELSDLAHYRSVSLPSLRRFKARIKNNYQRFISGDFPIRQVLKKPFALAQFTLGLIIETLNLSLPQGIKLRVQSDVPIGYGMGSSAAIILSVMHAIALYLRAPLSEERLLSLALQAENMQHGYSSGLDLQIAFHGGCLYRDGSKLQQRIWPTAMPLYIVHTGSPLTTTGQCIAQVAPHFKHSPLATDFASVTKAMDQAIRQQSLADLRHSILANHCLLVKIGVVPERVQAFIQQLTLQGGAGKICGAGAIAGQQAGALLAFSEEQEALSTLCAKFHYSFAPIQCTLRGLHVL